MPQVLPGMEKSIDSQRQALLSVIAQQGTLGAQAYQQQAAGQNAAFGQALAANAASTQGTGPGMPVGLLDKINGQSTALNNTYAMDTGLANAAFQNFNTGLSRANANYADQAKAAVPALREQTNGIIAQIQADLKAEAEARAFEREQQEWERQQRELDRQLAEQEAAWTDEERAFQREQMAHEKSMWEEGIAAEESEATTAGQYAGLEANDAKIIAEAANFDPSGQTAADLDAIFKTQQNLAGAVDQARGIIELAQQEDPNYTPDVASEDLRYMIELIARRYSLRNGFKNDNDLLTVLRDSGADVSAVPGYSSPGEYFTRPRGRDALSTRDRASADRYSGQGARRHYIRQYNRDYLQGIVDRAQSGERGTGFWRTGRARRAN